MIPVYDNTSEAFDGDQVVYSQRSPLWAWLPATGSHTAVQSHSWEKPDWISHKPTRSFKTQPDLYGYIPSLSHHTWETWPACTLNEDRQV